MKNLKYIVIGLIIVLTALVASCGQAEFDVTVYPANVEDIDLSALQGNDYIIKIETYVETGNLGIDLSKLVYNYTFNNKGTNSVKIEVRLSLYGEATLSNNNKLTVFLASSGGYGTTPPEKAWLTSTYKDRDPITADGYGWISMIGEPGSSISLAGNTKSTNETEISNSPVLNQILKQEGIWVVTYVSPDGGTLGLPAYMDIIDQSIQAVGSKATGYFPGVF